MLSTELGRLKLCGWIEGISFLLLLGVAMPLKYMMDMPMAVRWVGMAHGLLWMLYVSLLYAMYQSQKWPTRLLLGGLFASIMPFGPFIFERYVPVLSESPQHGDD
jgi:integral membrane protein